MGTLSIEQHLFPLVALSLFFAPCSLDRKKEEEETITAPSRPPPLPSFPLQFYARWLQSDESYDPTCTFAHSIAPIHQYHSFFAEISRRSSALKTLPGPSYGFGGVWRSLINKTVHRDTTQWADAHGPVYRVRFLHYHVSFFFSWWRKRRRARDCCEEEHSRVVGGVAPAAAGREIERAPI